ncbi:MAG: pyruvate:ferredoxin (flavodoxin) oxidoreductase, partial [Chitinispirillia bacterium]
DMGLIAMSYGYIYVGRVAMGANPNQVVKAFVEAEAYNGPSLLLCYSHCIAHGIDMTYGYNEQKNAVLSGHWPLYRYNPDLALQGKNPLIVESKEPTMSIAEFASNENRFKSLQRAKPEAAEEYLAEAQKHAVAKFEMLKHLSKMQMQK